MVERIGLQLTVVDTGWPTASTIGWGSPLMLPVVVGFIVINGHASVEINQNGEYRYFNYWIFLIMGSVVYAGTEITGFRSVLHSLFCVDAIGGRFNGAVFTKTIILKGYHSPSYLYSLRAVWHCL